MAGQVSLNSLIEALANAVIEAQDRIEQHQISNIRRYFDSDNRPISVFVKTPSTHPDAEMGDETELRVPLLALVSSNPLRIKDVEISFDADITDVDEPQEETTSPDQKNWDSKLAAKAIQVDMRSGFLRRGGKTAHVVLRVEGVEPTEGMARLMQHLLKLI
jgi:hypothetical protein